MDNVKDHFLTYILFYGLILWFLCFMFMCISYINIKHCAIIQYICFCITNFSIMAETKYTLKICDTLLLWYLYTTILHYFTFYHFKMQHAIYSHSSWHRRTFLLSFSPFSHSQCPCGSASVFVFLPCSAEGPLFHFAVAVSSLPPPDHCQGESPSSPCCCLAWHRLALPPHICMSCGVSAKVYSDVMGPDGSIFPADSDDCRAQV